MLRFWRQLIVLAHALVVFPRFGQVQRLRHTLHNPPRLSQGRDHVEPFRVASPRHKLSVMPGLGSERARFSCGTARKTARVWGICAASQLRGSLRATRASINFLVSALTSYRFVPDPSPAG